MDKLTVSGRISEIVADLVKGSDIELVHAEIAGPANQPIVRIFIDKPGGITHEDCSKVSLQLGDILDQEDVVSSAYTLEVSSPGLERDLYSIKDFEKFAGSLAKVKVKQPINGQRNFRGRIKAVDNEEIVFDDKTNGEVRFPFSIVAKANLEIDIEEEFRRHNASGNE